MILFDSEIERPALSPAPSRRVCVIGLGFAGLPTATAIASAIASAGHHATGLDIDPAKVACSNADRAPSGIPAEAIAPLIEQGSLVAGATDSSAIARAAVVLITVLRPSVPLDKVWPAGAVGADAAVVVTPHPTIDYAALAGKVGVVLDTRNALGKYGSDRIVSL